MKSFRQIFEEKTRKSLTEGGNTTVYTRQGEETTAAQIPLKEIGRKAFVTNFQNLLKFINKEFYKDHKRKLWVKEEMIANAFIFNGSTSYIMSPEYTDEEIVAVKPTAGDSDVMIPREDAQDLYKTLERFEKKEVIKDVKYMGTNARTIDKIGNTLICVFLMTFPVRDSEIRIPVQVDFELSDFENDTPTDWARFSHGSSFEDAKIGIKAVHHKYLLRALVGSVNVRDDIVIATPASKPDKITLKKKQEDLVRMLKFGVDRGVGNAYEQMIDDAGKPIKLNGKFVYREMKSVEKDYNKSLENLYKVAFGQEKVSEMNHLYSFAGLIKLGKKYLDKKTKERVLQRYFEILFGADGNQVQTIDPTDANKDVSIKTGAFNMIAKEWKLSTPKNFNTVVDNYVKRAFK